MGEFTVRPSLKRMKWGLFVATATLCGIVYVYIRFTEDLAWWFPLVGVIPFFAPLAAWLDSKGTSLAVRDGVVTYERGLVRKERKLSALAEISGVTVERNFTQRMWGTGTLIVETRGPAGRFVVPDVDRAKQVADELRKAGQTDAER